METSRYLHFVWFPQFFSDVATNIKIFPDTDSHFQPFTNTVTDSSLYMNLILFNYYYIPFTIPRNVSNNFLSEGILLAAF